MSRITMPKSWARHRGGVLTVLIMALLWSCNTPRKSSGGKSPIPERPPIEREEPEALAAEEQGREDSEALDTLDNIDDSLPESPDFETQLLSEYQVTLLLPFLANRFQASQGRLHNISEWSLHYYGGMKMALDDLRKEDVSLRVSIKDTQGATSTVERMLAQDSAVIKAHLLIGPYRRVNIQKVAEFGKRNEVNVVSPYSAAANMTADNPHYLQVRPSMKTHCEKLVRHALQRYQPQQIVLVGQDRELERASFNYFQEGYYKEEGTRVLPKLTEYLVKGETADFESIDVTRFVEFADTTVFIVSAWSPDDETFVYSLLRKIELARTPEQHVVVYGTPAWQEYDRTPLDYYEKMNVHLSSHSFFDPGDASIQNFRRKFYDRFGDIPSEAAFLGYDVMRYFGKMLKKYGTQFQYALEREPMEGLHTHFQFERVVEPGAIAELDPSIEHFENKFVHILQFKNYEFQSTAD